MSIYTKHIEDNMNTNKFEKQFPNGLFDDCIQFYYDKSITPTKLEEFSVQSLKDLNLLIGTK